MHLNKQDSSHQWHGQSRLCFCALGHPYISTHRWTKPYVSQSPLWESSFTRTASHLSRSGRSDRSASFYPTESSGHTEIQSRCSRGVHQAILISQRLRNTHATHPIAASRFDFPEIFRSSEIPRELFTHTQRVTVAASRSDRSVSS